MIFERPGGVVIELKETTGKTTNKLLERKNNPKITIPELAGELSISEYTINYYLMSLRQKGSIEKGRWAQRRLLGSKGRN